MAPFNPFKGKPIAARAPVILAQQQPSTAPATVALAPMRRIPVRQPATPEVVVAPPAPVRQETHAEFLDRTMKENLAASAAANEAARKKQQERDFGSGLVTDAAPSPPLTDVELEADAEAAIGSADENADPGYTVVPDEDDEDREAFKIRTVTWDEYTKRPATRTSLPRPFPGSQPVVEATAAVVPTDDDDDDAVDWGDPVPDDLLPRLPQLESAPVPTHQPVAIAPASPARPRIGPPPPRKTQPQAATETAAAEAAPVVEDAFDAIKKFKFRSTLDPVPEFTHYTWYDGTPVPESITSSGLMMSGYHVLPWWSVEPARQGVLWKKGVTWPAAQGNPPMPPIRPRSPPATGRDT